MQHASSEKIDVFCHILPEKFKDALFKKARPCYYVDADRGTPAIFDLDLRFRVMDQYEGLRQVLTIGAPPPEYVLDKKDAIDLAKLANDEMAELLVKYADRFVGAAACLPMNDMDAALEETDRAIKDLNFKGVQIFSSINGKPLDRPEFMPLYEKMEKYDLPIWIHPARDRDIPDYPNEAESIYFLFAIFGWPFETSLAMARLVFSGTLEKYSKVKFIVHHCGAMIPFFANRILAPSQLAKSGQLQKMPKGPWDYFKRFYADTVLNGNTSGLMCGYDFFGSDHMLFGSDYPYPGGEKKGDVFLGEAIQSVESMGIPQEEKEKIFSKNTRRILNLDS